MRRVCSGVLAAGLMLAGCATVPAGGPVQRDARAILEAPDLAGTRWGLLVLDEAGRELVAINPDERFLPASNTKLFTVAAAFRWLEELEAAAPELATTVELKTIPGSPPDVMLIGRGATEMGDGPDCVEVCLPDLADAVAATGVTRIRDVIGDDSWFADERWRGGWSWEDMQTSYGTAVSALVINANVIELEVRPGAAPGDPVIAQWREGDAIYGLDIQAVTGEAGSERTLGSERLPDAPDVRLHGALPLDSAPRILRLGVYDPALAAAQRLTRLLQARGIVVEGAPGARHRPLVDGDEAGWAAMREWRGCVAAADPVAQDACVLELPPAAPVMVEGAAMLAGRAAPPDFTAMLTTVSKDSQNLYAEIALRQLGRLGRRGSAADGLVRVFTLTGEAGVGPYAMDLNDGSGMSRYNRVSPRAIATLLRHAAEQDWGEGFRETLPVGGVDGSLERRFSGTPLEGRIFAKTGSLSGVNSLAGYMIAASGQVLTFSVVANERPTVAGSATAAMDAALVEIAAAY